VIEVYEGKDGIEAHRLSEVCLVVRWQNSLRISVEVMYEIPLRIDRTVSREILQVNIETRFWPFACTLKRTANLRVNSRSADDFTRRLHASASTISHPPTGQESGAILELDESRLLPSSSADGDKCNFPIRLKVYPAERSSLSIVDSELASASRFRQTPVSVA